MFSARLPNHPSHLQSGWGLALPTNKAAGFEGAGFLGIWEYLEILNGNIATHIRYQAHEIRVHTSAAFWLLVLQKQQEWPPCILEVEEGAGRPALWHQI